MSETYTEAELDHLAHIGIAQNLGLFIIPILFGLLLDSVLFGIAITQYVHWWQHARNDRLFNRVIIGLTATLITLTTIFNIAWMTHLFAYGFSHWYRFFELDWLRWNILLDVLTVTINQIFYLERAYQLTNRSKWTLITMLPLLIASLVGGLLSTAAGWLIVDGTEIQKVEPFFFVWTGGTLTYDVILTTLISYRLIKAKTGWSSTDWVLTKLARLSVESQLASTIMAIAFMISYGILPVDGLNVFFELFHPKVYVIGLMALLNARGSLRMNSSPAPIAPGPLLQENIFQIGNKGNSNGPTQPTVMMDQLTYTDAGITLPSLIIDIDRRPHDRESAGEMGLNSFQMTRSMPSDVAPSPVLSQGMFGPSEPCTDGRLLQQKGFEAGNDAL